MTTYSPPQAVRQNRLRNMTDLVIVAQQLHHLAVEGGSRCIYHFDSVSQEMKKWAWPCYLGDDALTKPVPPDELEQYARNYVFRTPCCPCAYVQGVPYTPTKVSLLESVNEIKNDPLRRPFIGEYVAECATTTCGYFVVLERFYGSRALPHRVYEKRAAPYNPSLFALMKERGHEITPDSKVCGFRRILVSPQTNEFSRGSNKLKRPRESIEEEVSDGVDDEKLRCLMRDGLAEDEFWELFVQCAHCGHVSRRAAYPYAHRCSKKAKATMGELRPETIDFVEVTDAEADEEERQEQEEEEELDRQLDILQAAMRPRRRPLISSFSAV